MRVYGSSPLYNYVELIFRSKRLFIAAIVVATAITASVAGMRAGTYEAKALVYLTGADNPQATGMNEVQRGSIQYKMNILSICTKDPRWFADAMREKGLARGMSDQKFEEFCKKAVKALTFASGNNVLEITCRWEDPRAADIVDGFYSRYADRVVGEETAASSIAAESLRNRLKEYTEKQKGLEDKVNRFKQEHVDAPLADYQTMLAQLNQNKQTVEAMQVELGYLQNVRAEVERQLHKTEKKILEASLYNQPKDDPAIERLQTESAVVDQHIAELRTKYNDNNPLIKKQLELKANIDQEIETRKKIAAGAKPTGRGTATQQKVVINPQYQALEEKRNELDLSIKEYQGRLNGAMARVEESRTKARISPEMVTNFEWMTKDLALYTGIRDNLRASLEKADMIEKQEHELHMAEMRMIVRPEAELEMAGGKNIIFFAAGPLLGIIIAFAFSLFFETLDHSLRTPIEVEKYLDKPVLAVLPRMETPKDSNQRRLGGGSDKRPTLPS